MNEMPRRAMLRSAAVAGTAASLSVLPATAAAAPPNQWTPEELKDRKRVLEAGFTEAEADCWLLVARAGGAFFALPELHPSIKPEVVQAIHVLQDKLMMRPAYRKYRAANP
ncbi:hypothetical protein NLX83_32755 [Allokutzneria sp. A3M-2-11 16]|uniref:hypothetical protein n=1 Tax=Allokutzneria sp. A3M-2-11 16 TaxID=2962043 RepID=UPI0020B81618|nr:hypothetical protein [Allokutzneria sp. A3M-2-11 16]MCP3804052.1 hypothetical protein [Allokutzneria sp. A3M-2-11 16]